MQALINVRIAVLVTSRCVVGAKQVEGVSRARGHG